MSDNITGVMGAFRNVTHWFLYAAVVLFTVAENTLPCEDYIIPDHNTCVTLR